MQMELQVLQVKLVPSVQRELQAPQALRGLPVLLVQMELQVPMGPWVKLALRVRLVQQGPRVLQVKQVRLVQQDLLVQRELQAPQALRGLPVLLVQMELQVRLVQQDPREPQVQREPQVLQVKPEQLAL
ncbi:MAG: hypothetical protein Q7J58_18060 [Hydrogenophaga sp.]|uniref:hypothetical protein n=1 Tax=Hydrogenophaga sp. TaxID=1904254 RepID=UPI00271B32EA|nr:hypothetical protein [Hydrogenophaga sp.]MDO9571259.1 hypothetical protein [Hydrogenophaga sp.]